MRCDLEDLGTRNTKHNSDGVGGICARVYLVIVLHVVDTGDEIARCSVT